ERLSTINSIKKRCAVPLPLKAFQLYFYNGLKSIAIIFYQTDGFDERRRYKSIIYRNQSKQHMHGNAQTVIK
ncbi:MAG: hypothetical protein QMB24_07415, partial [Spirosomataceae bacterium]